MSPFQILGFHSAARYRQGLYTILEELIDTEQAQEAEKAECVIC